jgi:protein-disulfide isomerase
MRHRLPAGLLALLLCSACVTAVAGPAPLERADPAVDGAPVGCVQGAEPIFKVSVPRWAPVLGDRQGALVTVVIFSEFQCPFCARLHPTLKDLLARYPGQVRVVYRHNPLAFHPAALPSAKAAQAAGRQGRFWEMADLLFGSRERLQEPEHFVALANQLGLDPRRFEADMASPEVAAEIAEDQAEAERLGARGVPTAYVNGTLLVGAQPLQAFVDRVEAVLPQARRAGGRGDALYARLTACGLTDRPVERPPAPRPEPPAARQVVDPGNSYWLGGRDARVEVVVFSDLQCPYCGKLAGTLKELLDLYGPRLRVHFKHMPLAFHKDAFQAAEALMAAGAQGKFWPMHDKLFAGQRALAREDLERYAQELGLDVYRFRAELDQGTYKAEIEADQAQAAKLGVRGTPTTFVNGWLVSGALSLQQLKEIIERELSGGR